MGLFKRVNDIISANVNELVDQFEDPEKMLRQAVREMETAIGRALDGAAKVIANERRLARQIADLNSAMQGHRDRAQQAVQRGDDHAARLALTHKTESEKLAAALEDQRVAAADAATKLKRQVAAMRVRMAEARRKALTYSARRRAAEARVAFARNANAACFDASTFSRFDRIVDGIEQSEAEAEALLELSGAPFEIDPIDADVETELASLKQSLL